MWSFIIIIILIIIIIIIIIIINCFNLCDNSNDSVSLISLVVCSREVFHSHCFLQMRKHLDCSIKRQDNSICNDLQYSYTRMFNVWCARNREIT